MPSLEQAQKPAPENYEPVKRPTPPISQAETGNLTPVQNPSMRCPVPQTNFSADANTQFYRGNTVPQYRTFSPSQLVGTGNTGGSTTTVTNVESSGSSTTNTVSLSIKNASLTTPVLNPNQTYTTSLALSRAIAILHVTATAAARIRVYATAAAQTLDLSRATTQAPAFGVTQGIILDLTLDTSPYMWLCSPVALGANGDSPTAALGYITITQIAPTSGTITATFQYLPLES